MYVKSFTLLFLLSVVLIACKKDDEGPIDKGEADFSAYIAVGSSLTAGFTDNGLYREAQLVSFPNLLAKQFKRAGSGNFTQPLFNENQANGTGYLKLVDYGPQGPVIINETSKLASRGIGADGKTTLLSKYEDKTNNLGIPGLKMSDVVIKGYGSNNPFGFNPFFERILSTEKQNQNYLEIVSESNPSFFTCWVGNNDILDYALSGGLANTTSYEFFSSNCQDLFGTLTANGAKGVTANIIDFTVMPFFTTVTVANVREKANGAPLYISTNGGLVREANEKDLLLLTADSIGVVKNGVAKGFDQAYPLNNEDVLDSEEVAFALGRISGYNELIQQAANIYNIPVVNAKELFIKIKNGFIEDGVIVNATFISGGVYSLDGIHLTPRGNAVLANEFIKVINYTYKSKLPYLNISKYGAVKIRN